MPKLYQTVYRQFYRTQLLVNFLDQHPVHYNTISCASTNWFQKTEKCLDFPLNFDENPPPLQKSPVQFRCSIEYIWSPTFAWTNDNLKFPKEYINIYLQK